MLQEEIYCMGKADYLHMVEGYSFQMVMRLQNRNGKSNINI